MFERLKNLFSKESSPYEVEKTNPIVALLLNIAMFPIRVLFYPFESVAKSINKPGDFDADYRGEHVAPPGFLPKVGFWTKKIGWGILMIPILILKAPFAFFQAIIRDGRTDLLFVIPALAMFGFFGFVFFQVFAKTDSIQQRYRRGAQRALINDNMELAKTYFERIANEEELNDNERLQWAMILSRTGQAERAVKLIDDLAPDSAVGFKPAHRIKALNLAARLSTSKDPMMLSKMRFHLENSREDSEPINRAWAAYYLAVEQPDEAMKYLRKSSDKNPEFLLMIASINERDGNTTLRNEALDEADKIYRERLEKDPLDVRSRVALANTLARKNELNEAEQILLRGLKLQPEPFIRRETAGFFMLRHDLASKEGEAFSAQFNYLQKALSLDSSFAPVYQRMIALYQNKPEGEDASELKESLLDIVTGDSPSAMAHFALSNILWMEGEHEQAEWHVEQAYNLDNNFVIVVNNLAWMLAHKTDPDLDRAFELAKTALNRAPNDPRFLDTYASILLKLGKHDEAISYFQKALPRTGIANEIHGKLAICYREIGQPDMADRHEKQAKTDK